MKRLLLPVLVCLLLVAGAGPAKALLCNFSVSNMVFDDADVIVAGDTAEADITINCTGIAFTTTKLCLNLNAGAGGADAAGRYMTGPGGTLRYQLFQDSGRSIIWGSTTWGLPGGPKEMDITFPLSGSVSTSTKIYGAVFAPQAGVAPGAYSSAFAGAQVQFAYATLALFDCNTILGLPPLFSNPGFTVSADVKSNCIVDAQMLDFGTRGVLNTVTETDSALSVTCTQGTTYTIGLNGGVTLQPPAARLMKRTTGSETISYGIYRDNARTLVWGNSAGVDTKAGSGTGAAQNHGVYGRVPAQTTPVAGTYTDTIVVTVTY